MKVSKKFLLYRDGFLVRRLIEQKGMNILLDFWYNEKQELYTLFGQRRSICKEGRICGRKACSLS